VNATSGRLKLHADDHLTDNLMFVRVGSFASSASDLPVRGALHVKRRNAVVTVIVSSIDPTFQSA